MIMLIYFEYFGKCDSDTKDQNGSLWSQYKASGELSTLNYHLRVTIVGEFHRTGVWWAQMGSALLAGKRLLWWQVAARAPRQTRARHQVGAIFGN